MAGLHVNGYLKNRSNVLGLRVPEIGKVRSIVNTALCRVVIALSKRTVVHQTYYSRHRYPRSNPLVLTVFDMTHEVCCELFRDFPDQVQQSRNKRICCERADHICAISQHTKNDLMRILNVPAERISVTHLGNPWRASFRFVRSDQRNSNTSSTSEVVRGIRTFRGCLKHMADPNTSATGSDSSVSAEEVFRARSLK